MGEGITVAMSGKLRLRRRAAACARNCLQPDAGGRIQAPVAGLYLAQGPRLGGAAHRQRKRRTPRHRDQRHLCRRCSPAARQCPKKALSVEIVGSSTTLRPVAGLPSIRDADMTLRLNGRTAKVTLGKGTVDVSPGRRLTVSNGLFEVPNTRGKTPPARVSFRVEARCPPRRNCLRWNGCANTPARRSTPPARAARSAGQVQLGMPLRPDLPPGSTDYDITVDLANFSADKMLFGQKVEAQTLRVIGE